MITDVRYNDPAATSVRVSSTDRPDLVSPWPANGWISHLIVTWLEAGNAIAPWEPPPVTASAIKAEARRRIVAACPDWRQANMTARGLELVRRGETTWTAAEQAEVAAIEAVWTWIKAVRETSNLLETTLPSDYAADHRWPPAS